jgi:hypothetical protein
MKYKKARWRKGENLMRRGIRLMPSVRRSFAGIDGVVVVLDFSIMPTLVMRLSGFCSSRSRFPGFPD